VVNDDGNVLVIQRRDNGHWEPPGGVLELGESFEACYGEKCSRKQAYT